MIIDDETYTRTAFDAQLWALHRNSLAFSGLLILLCLPGISVNQTQSVFWLSITGATLIELRAVSAIIATYAIVAFILEWLHEVLPFWRERNGLTATYGEAVNGIARNALSACQEYERLLTAARTFGEEASKALALVAERAELSSALGREHLQAAASTINVEFLAGKISRRLPGPNGQPLFTAHAPADAQTMDVIRNAVSRTIFEITDSSHTQWRASEAAATTHIGNQLEGFQNALADARSNVPKIDLSPIATLKRLLLGRQLGLIARVWLISLGVPVGLFCWSLCQWARTFS